MERCIILTWFRPKSLIMKNISTLIRLLRPWDIFDPTFFNTCQRCWYTFHWYDISTQRIWFGFPVDLICFQKRFQLMIYFVFFSDLLMARTRYCCVLDYEKRSTSCTHIPASQRSSSINDRLFAKNIVLFDVKFVLNLTGNYFHNLIPFLCVIDGGYWRRLLTEV